MSVLTSTALHHGRQLARREQLLQAMPPSGPTRPSSVINTFSTIDASRKTYADPGMIQCP